MNGLKAFECRYAQRELFATIYFQIRRNPGTFPDNESLFFK